MKIQLNRWIWFFTILLFNAFVNLVTYMYDSLGPLLYFYNFAYYYFALAIASCAFTIFITWQAAVQLEGKK